jgi:hypothetical protein
VDSLTMITYNIYTLGSLTSSMISNPVLLGSITITNYKYCTVVLILVLVILSLLLFTNNNNKVII